MEKFGEYLKAQREKKGIRLEEIASITKIHLHSLELLESNNWEKLPPEPFIRGFIIAYSKYVGLDSKETITRYNDEVRERQAALNPQAATPESTETASEVIEHTRSFPMGKIAVGGGAMAFVLLVAVMIYVGKRADTPEPGRVTTTQTTGTTSETKDDNRAVAAKPETVTPNAVTPGPIDGAPKTDTTGTGTTTAPGEEFAHELVVEEQERTWMKVVVDDKPPMELFLPKGQKGVYRAKAKIKLVLGNANGAVVKHNGEVVKGQKFQGTIRFYIYPQGSRFPQDKGSRKVAKEVPESDENAGSSTESTDE